MSMFKIERERWSVSLNPLDPPLILKDLECSFKVKCGKTMFVCKKGAVLIDLLTNNPSYYAIDAECPY